MPRKFLSFLGNSQYDECTYYLSECKNNHYKSAFVQDALLHLLPLKLGTIDEAVFFLTDQARKINWDNTSASKSTLKTILNEHSHVALKDVAIPNGKSENEIWDIFHVIVDAIDENDEVIFDITHSFRSIPMLALTALNFLKVTKNITLSGIYYGCFDGRDSKNFTPIFDLSSFDDIFGWSQAVNMFLHHGDSGPMYDIAMKEIDSYRHKSLGQSITKSIIERIHDFTMCIYTSRGNKMPPSKKNKYGKKSFINAYKEAKGQMEELKKHELEVSLIPLQSLMEKIEKRLESFNTDDIFLSGLASIKWCIDNKLIQQGYTALDETIKTYVCQKFSLDPTSYNDRENIVNCAMKVKELKKQKENWICKDPDQVALVYDGLTKDIVSLSSRVSDRRNDINHFGFNHNAKAYHLLEKDLKVLYDELCTIAENDKSMIQRKENE